MRHVYSVASNPTEDEGDIILLEVTGANPARCLTDNLNLTSSQSIRVAELLTEAHIRGREDMLSEINSMLMKKHYGYMEEICQTKTKQ